MELFIPPKRLLRRICRERNKPLINYEVYTKDHVDEVPYEEKQRLLLMGLRGKLAEFFGLGLEPERVSCQGFSVVSEGLANGLVHSGSEVPYVVYGLFLGDLGVCHEFLDGGDFFKKQEVKVAFENRRASPEVDTRPGKHNGAGLSFIYENSDFIEVDTDQGVLYCMQVKDRFILPKK